MDIKHGIIRPELQELPQIKDRMTYIYLEHCKVNRSDGAITATDETGVVHIPAAMISVLMLGPGASITHSAIELIGDTGATVIWVGEHGVRFYAGGKPLTHHSSLLLKQAEFVSNQRKHLAVVRKMYEMRFPNEDVTGLTLQQLRGREGSRMRNIYRTLAEEYGVDWNGRDYDADDYSSGNAVNRALSAGHACLYGLAHAVIYSMGCTPGLGFVHIGHDRSFVYDIADLYKADITIPIAFEAASNPNAQADIGGYVRRKVRNAIVEKHLLDQMVRDIKYLLSEDIDESTTQDSICLWDNKNGSVAGGTLYKERGSNEW